MRRLGSRRGLHGGRRLGSRRRSHSGLRRRGGRRRRGRGGCRLFTGSRRQRPREGDRAVHDFLQQVGRGDVERPLTGVLRRREGVRRTHRDGLAGEVVRAVGCGHDGQVRVRGGVTAIGSELNGVVAVRHEVQVRQVRLDVLSARRTGKGCREAGFAGTQTLQVGYRDTEVPDTRVRRGRDGVLDAHGDGLALEDDVRIVAGALQHRVCVGGGIATLCHERNGVVAGRDEPERRQNRLDHFVPLLHGHLAGDDGIGGRSGRGGSGRLRRGGLGDDLLDRRGRLRGCRNGLDGLGHLQVGGVQIGGTLVGGAGVGRVGRLAERDVVDGCRGRVIGIGGVEACHTEEETDDEAGGDHGSDGLLGLLGLVVASLLATGRELHGVPFGSGPFKGADGWSFGRVGSLFGPRPNGRRKLIEHDALLSSNQPSSLLHQRSLSAVKLMTWFDPKSLGKL